MMFQNSLVAQLRYPIFYSIKNIPVFHSSELVAKWFLTRPLWNHYLQELLDLDTSKEPHLCRLCGVMEGLLQCKYCFSQHLLCQNCIITSHNLLQLHKLEQWDGLCFQNTSLFDQESILSVVHWMNPIQGLDRISLMMDHL